MARLAQKAGSMYIVYVDDCATEWVKVAEEFGMVRGGEPLSSTSVDTGFKYRNANGVVMDGVKLTGRTVELFITNAAVSGKVFTSDDMVGLLNRFPCSRTVLGGIVYNGKFSPSSIHIVADREKNRFALGTDRYPKVDKITELVEHLVDDNGDMFRPVIARYVYISREMPRRMKAVGYFDLNTYVRVIESNARDMFLSVASSKAPVALTMRAGDRITVRVVSVIDGVATVEITGHSGVADANKLLEFKPIVILSLEPLRIGTMRFPVQKVVFDHTTVFMTPILSKTDAWESLQGGIDLLAPLRS